MSKEISSEMLMELVLFIEEHSKTIQEVRLSLFKDGSHDLVNVVVKACRDWLQGLIVNIAIQKSLSELMCSRLGEFKMLKHVRLQMGNSLDPDVMMEKCGPLFERGKLLSFHSTSMLRTKSHLSRFIKCLGANKSIESVSFSLLCIPQNELVEIIGSLERVLINLKVFLFLIDVPSMQYLNLFKTISQQNKEFNLCVVGINDKIGQNGLSNVNELEMQNIKDELLPETLPQDVKRVILSFSKIGLASLTIHKFLSIFKQLKYLQLSNGTITVYSDLVNKIPSLEELNCEDCSIGNNLFLQLSSNIKKMNLKHCRFSADQLDETFTLPHLVEFKCTSTTGVSSRLLLGSKHLEVLDLSSSVLLHDTLTDFAFISDMTNLRILNLNQLACTREYLKNFDFSTLKNLQTLSLYDFYCSRCKPNRSLSTLIGYLNLSINEQYIYNFENETMETMDNIPISMKELERILKEYLANYNSIDTCGIMYILHNKQYITAGFHAKRKIGQLIVLNDGKYTVQKCCFLSLACGYSEDCKNIHSFTIIPQKTSSGNCILL